MKKLLLLLFICYTHLVSAQNDSTKKWTFSTYGELYYSYDFAQPSTHEKEDFIYNHKRHNEINANLILVKAQYNDNSTRANLALMAGNYAQYNLSKEPTWAQYINEANIGFKLSKKNSLWLDAGIIPSHLGFESAISADCWTITRSILAENSPYYETGLRLQYSNKNEKLNLSFLLLNGWQKIQKPNYFQIPSVGLQLNYKITDELIFNYSNFVGTDKADSLNALRAFHNFYAQYEGKRKFGFIAGLDIGTDKYNTHDYGIWFSPVLIARYTLNKKSRIALRGEYYNDKHQIIISTHTPQGFQVSSLSVNYDYRINSAIQWRIEGKIFDAKDKIFSQQKENQNFSLTTNVTVRF